MIETLLVAVVVALLPLGVVSILGAIAYAAVGERVESVVVGVVLIEASFLLVGASSLALAGDDLVVRLRAPSITDLTLALALVPFPFALDVGGDWALERVGVVPEATLDLSAESVPAAVLVAFVLVGPAEELLYRGIVQELLIGRLGPIGGVAAMAVLFAAVHYPSYGADSVREIDLGVVTGMAQTGVVGAVYGGLYLATGTLLAPIITHSLYDALLFAHLGGAIRIPFWGDR